MIQSAAVIFIVAALAYIWASRGFFSSMLHMVCVLVAGAVAFAAWEPISYAILDYAGNKQWLIDVAWGAGLALPFAITLAVIRLACDKLVPANTDLDGVPNLVGGAACGLVTGTITAGIMIISINFLHLPPSIGGVEQIRQESNGSPVINDKLIFPVDKITAGLYGYTSESSFRSATPLAVWRPTVTVDGGLMRTTFNEGGSRHALAPKAFDITHRWTFGKKDAKLKVSDLLKDGFSTGTPKASTLAGEDVSAGSTNYYIEAFVVSFSSAAREKEGSIVIGNTQVQLVCHNEADGESISLHPVAVSSKADPVDAEDKRIRYGRWRFERPNTYVRSVGGTDNALMAFEFLVPRGYTPIALYVKGVREDITRLSEGEDYATVKDRDTAIGKGTALKGEEGVAPILKYTDPERKAVIIDPEAGDVLEKPINVTNAIPRNKNTVTILSKDNIGKLQLNEDRQIIGGEHKFKLSDFQKNRGIDAKLQVRSFFDGEGMQIVQVDFGKDSELGPVVNFAAQEATGAPLLVDARGEQYPCIGFVYYDNQLAHFRFTPEATIRSKEELPFGGPSTSRPDQAYILLFRVGKNTKLTEVRIGSTKIAELKPNLTIK